MQIEERWIWKCGVLILGGVFGALLFGPNALLAQVAGDGIPPKLSNIKIESFTATSAVVSWETDEEADSEVNYGLTKAYGVARDPLANKKTHRILLDDLEPSTFYHIRVGSADYGGNQALSGDYGLTTKGVVSIVDIEKIPPEDRVTVEKAVQSIRDIKSYEGLKTVIDELGEVAKKVIEAPRIIGSPGVKEVGSDYAIVTWATDQDAGSVVRYARDQEYNSNAENPYTTESGDAGERTKEHSVRITGLNPGTLYHFQVVSEADFGLSGESRDDTFITKAQLPSILNFRIIKVEEDSATLAWRTSIPAAGIVEYTNTKTNEKKSAGSPIFALSHQVKIAGLSLGVRYNALVKAENVVGDKVSSSPLSFTTIRDVAPPLISKVSNESTLFPSADAKVQTIVSWATDEEAYCQFFYRDGLNPDKEAMGLGEEKEPRTSHVQVVVEFLPSTVYQFWVACRDDARNESKSENFVLFTPNKEKSIIDIILENFQGTFGWVKNIGK
jgi:hypothetical protein